jgi:hypothetical protein
MFYGRYATVWILTAALAAVSIGAAPVPAQIDDATFWRMVTAFSEPTGTFLSENFVSNEPDYQRVLARLQPATRPGGAYLGVGPEQNFTYIVALKPGIAFIIDIRRQNLVQHLMYKAIFELSADRPAFLSMLFSRKRPEGLSERSTPTEMLEAYSAVPADAELARKNRQALKELLVKQHRFELSAADLETLDHIHHVFELYGPETGYGSNATTVDFTNGRGRNGNLSTILVQTDEQGINRGFLATEEAFRAIKDFQRRNLLVPVVGDFGGDKALGSVAQYLHAQQATVTAFYVSNVEQYLFLTNATQVPNGGARKFYENVGALPLDRNSTFIRVQSNRQAGHFTSHLGSMLETVQVFRERGFRGVQDVFALSK